MTTTMAAAVIEIASNFDVTIEAAIHNAMSHYVTTTTAVNHSDYYESFEQFSLSRNNDMQNIIDEYFEKIIERRFAF